MDENDEETRNRIKLVGIFVTIPFVLGVPPVIGWFIGDWIDKKLGIGPYMMYILILLGFVAGFREVYRIIKKYGKEM